MEDQQEIQTTSAEDLVKGIEHLVTLAQIYKQSTTNWCIHALSNWMIGNNKWLLYKIN